MDVHILPDGPVLRISEDRGPHARGCRLDAGVLEAAVAATLVRLGACAVPQMRGLRGRMIRLSLFLCALCLALPARAEMDPSDYEVPPAELSAEEPDARRLAEAEAAARPVGAQLVEARCASCHSAETYRATNQGWLGWRATVWRMDLLNGAEVAAGEHGVIADWLYAQHPPAGGRAALEWLAILLVVVALPLPWALWRRRN